MQRSKTITREFLVAVIAAAAVELLRYFGGL
jgi:hypothetical protein